MVRRRAAVAAALVAALACAGGPRAEAGEPARVGAAPARVASSEQPAALALPDVAGVRQDLHSLRGRVVVVNFWATWCRPCRHELPVLARLQSRFGARGLQVVGAAADGPETAASVLRHAEDAGVNFPVWLGASIEDMKRFGLPPALPGTAVLDRGGRIAARFPGVFEERDLVTALESALAGSEAATQDAAAPSGASPGGSEAAEHGHGHAHARAARGHRHPRGSLVPS